MKRSAKRALIAAATAFLLILGAVWAEQHELVGGSARAAVTMDSMSIALALGDVLGSEDFCGLHYDQGAIKKFIDSRVKENDMEFAPMLKAMTQGSRFQNQAMSPSEKAAHCEQITRVARSYGFTQ